MILLESTMARNHNGPANGATWMAKWGVLFLCGVLFSACASPRGWTYAVMPAVDRLPVVSKSLAVPPLADERQPENEIRTGWVWIPLVPYGWLDLNTPETVQMHLTSGLWQFKPVEDIAKALAGEIQNRHIFKEAFFTFRESEGELVLRGALLSTKYEGKVYSYGLSAVGIDLWLLGAPTGSIKNAFALKLQLEDRGSQKTLWEKTYESERKTGVFWIYNLPSDFWYDSMLKELMPEILSDLEAAAKGSPVPTTAP